MLTTWRRRAPEARAKDDHAHSGHPGRKDEHEELDVGDGKEEDEPADVAGNDEPPWQEACAQPDGGAVAYRYALELHALAATLTVAAGDDGPAPLNLDRTAGELLLASSARSTPPAWPATSSATPKRCST